MRHLLTVAAAGVALATAAPSARAQATEAVDRAVAAWGKVRTVRGTFEQTVTNPLTESNATTHGDYAQERPNRLSIRFRAPQTDAIVSDGQTLWVYLPSSAPGQVIKRPATDRASVPIDLTGQFLDSPRTKYNIVAAGTKTVDGHATHAVTLTPKPGTTSTFTKATVWIDDDDSLIREFEATETSGVVRHVHLTSVDVNAPVDRATFTFKAPKGVKVVDQMK